MKTFLFKLFAIVLIFSCSLNSAQAQTPFSTDSHVLHGGFGLGGYGIGFGNGISSTPILTVTYDQGIVDDLGIGNLGIGGGFGIKYYNFDNIDASLTRMFVGARGTYHFDFVNSETFDFYAGVMIGADFYTSNIDGFEPSSSGLFGGPLAGINYWFKPNIGVYAEAGYALGILNGGIAFNF